MDFPPQGVARRRQWLADVLGDRVVEPGLGRPFADVAGVVEAAQAEGVLTLVAARLQALSADDPLRRAFTHAARASTVIAMLREAECRRVLELLQAANIDALLLKGSALAWWLYPAPHLRDCSDIDLLFASREAVEEASRKLKGHGFESGYSQGGETYEKVCRRTLSDSLTVDLDMHWRLLSVPVFANVLGFDELWDASRPLPALGKGARGLSPIHALLHACMHRAVNLYDGIDDRLKWLYDIHLLAQSLSPDEWDELERLCRVRGMCGICVVAIDAAAGLFHTTIPVNVMAALRSARHGERLDAHRLRDWPYMQWQNLVALPSLPRKLRWFARRLFPRIGYMRELYGSEKSLGALLLARGQRLLQRILDRCQRSRGGR